MLLTMRSSVSRKGYLWHFCFSCCSELLSKKLTNLRSLNLDFCKNKAKKSKDTAEIIDNSKRICDGSCSTKFFNIHPSLKGFLIKWYYILGLYNAHKSFLGLLFVSFGGGLFLRLRAWFSVLCLKGCLCRNITREQVSWFSDNIRCLNSSCKPHLQKNCITPLPCILLFQMFVCLDCFLYCFG